MGRHLMPGILREGYGDHHQKQPHHGQGLSDYRNLIHARKLEEVQAYFIICSAHVVVKVLRVEVVELLTVIVFLNAVRIY